MMKPTRIILALILAAAACYSAHGQSQAEMNQSSLADFQKADARLNAVYKKTFASLDDDGKKKLLASERAWLAYRDAQADFESDAEARGGSMEPMVYNNVCLALTEARIKELANAGSQ